MSDAVDKPICVTFAGIAKQAFSGESLQPLIEEALELPKSIRRTRYLAYLFGIQNICASDKKEELRAEVLKKAEELDECTELGLTIQLLSFLHTYCKFVTCIEKYTNIAEMVEAGKNARDLVPKEFRTSTNTIAKYIEENIHPEVYIEMIPVLREVLWADSGFPVIKISPRFAAAAMLTKALPSITAKLRAPWKSFVIELPKEPILYAASDEYPNTAVSIIRVWESNDAGTFWNVETGIYGSDQQLIFSCNREQFGEEEGDALYRNPLKTETSSRTKNAIVLVKRLIISTVCALTNADMIEHVGHSSKGKSKKQRSSPVPTCNIYKIVAPVTLDLVKTVQDMQLGTKKGHVLTVQSMTAGHWRWQPHGPQHTLRKHIWIQPYWRGPEDAPIAVRPHIMKDEATT